MTSVTTLQLRQDSLSSTSTVVVRQPQQQSKPTTTIPSKQQQQQQLSSPPNDMKYNSIISKTQQPEHHIAKQSNKYPKRQRPKGDDKSTTMRSSNVSKNHFPIVTNVVPNFMASDFPPLLSSSSSSSTQKKTTLTMHHPTGNEVRANNHSHYPSSSSSVKTMVTPPTTTSTTPKFLLKKSSNGNVSTNSILQPTALEFHPPPSTSSSSSSRSNITASVQATMSTKTVLTSLPPQLLPIRTTTTTTTTMSQPKRTLTIDDTTAVSLVNLQQQIEEFPPLSINNKNTILKQQQTISHSENPRSLSLPVLSKKVKKKVPIESAVTNSSPSKNDSKKKVDQSKSASTTLKTNDTKKEIIDLKVRDRIVNESGAQFDLLRLFQNGKIPPTATINNNNNGGQFIQRITPKKKKFSSLKKKVLEERLRQWQVANGILPKNESNDQPQSSSSSSSSSSPASPTESTTATSTATTVCLHGFAYEIDNDDDDDEYKELVENLREMASKIGPVRRIFIPRTYSTETHWPAFVEFSSRMNPDSSKDHVNDHFTAITAANAAVQCWNTLVLGGQTLSCRLLPIEKAKSEANKSASNEEDDDDETWWRNRCLTVELASSEQGVPSKSFSDAIAETPVRSEVLLHNILTEDDLDDEDCLQESLNDIRIVASKYGEVLSIVALRTKDDDQLSSDVIVMYSGDASNAVAELNKIIFGGQPVIATLTSSSSPKSFFTVNIRNLITDDDLEDESCLEESLNDIKELATQYGEVKNVSVDPPEDPSKLTDCNMYTINICYSTKSEAQAAIKGFDGMLIGGQAVTAALDAFTSDSIYKSNEIVRSTNCDNEPKPLYSGDKLISERFAECKRVPKIVNQSVSPRPYAKLVNDESIKPTIIEMLSELMRLQKRALEENNTKAKRRLVMGLREVARGIRSHKVKLVIMANNLDEYGVIDKTVQDIIDLAKTEEVPIFYELNKKGLGKAIGKSIKIAVIGVQSADGAHQQYKKLMSYAAKNF